MDRRAFLQASAAMPFLGTILEPYAQPLIANNSFAQALKRSPWLIGFAGTNAEMLQSRAKLRGTIPKGLSGDLYRNGPAQQEVYGFRYKHWFDGDGMVHKYTIGEQGVDHLARMISTDKYIKEREVQRALYPAFDSIPPDPALVTSPDSVNVANISMLVHNDELLALWEAGSAHRIDSQTLETLGKKQWSAKTEGVAFSAHPRLDSNGELWNFGYISFAKSLIIWHIDQLGKLKRTRIIEVDPITMPHDFLVTEKHLVILLPPFNFDTQARGKSFLASHVWQPEQATRVLVIDKNSLELKMTLELPAQWIFHYSNAWEDSSGVIRFEAPRAEDPGLMTQFAREVMQGVSSPDQSWTSLYNYRIDTHRKQASEERLFGSERICEFPSINKHYSSKEHSMVVILTQNANDLSTRGFRYLNAVSVMNIRKESEQNYRYPKNQIPEEHIFVPSKKATRESQGWILGTFIDYHEQTTGLNIFDAERVADGPVATARLPYLVPLGLHGTFVPTKSA